MAQDDLVDGDGWISDDSSFYGDKDVRAACELAARRPLKRAYQPPVPQSARKKIKLVSPPNSSSSSTTQLKAEPRNEPDVLSFLKSRPQIAEYGKLAKIASPFTDRVEVPDRWLGCDSAWQRNETIESFLRRKPVDDPSTTTYDGEGWLWVDSPTQPRAQIQSRKARDMAAFKQGAYALLQAFKQHRADIERDLFGKPPGVITRKMTPHREELESDLLSLACKTGITSGKWMLFPREADLARFWRVVATATSEGKLGSTCKSAIYSLQKSETLICIYNNDFSESDEVRRVLEELVSLDLCSAGGMPIYYKCDAYTHLDLTSNNDYKLRASLYSSKEVLKNEVTAFANGPVSRLKKRDDKMEHFFSMTGDDIS